MFNLQGSEIIIIMLLALVVLGPEKLPDAMRKAGKMYADLKKMASGFQDEFKSVIEEPVRELQETANLLRDSADFTKLASGEREEKPQSAVMGDADSLAPADPGQIPVDELPFGPSGEVDRPVGTSEFDELPDPSRPGADDAVPHPPSDDAGTGATATEPTDASAGQDSDPAGTDETAPRPDSIDDESSH